MPVAEPIPGLSGQQVEDVVSFWRSQRPVMIGMLGISIFTFVMFLVLDLGTGVFFMAELASTLTIVPAVLFLFPGIAGDIGLASQIRICNTMTKIAVCLNCLALVMISTLLLALGSFCAEHEGEIPFNSDPYDQDDGHGHFHHHGANDPTNGHSDGDEVDEVSCAVIWLFSVSVMLMIVLHTTMGVLVARRSDSASLMLNPASSGIVSV